MNLNIVHFLLVSSALDLMKKTFATLDVCLKSFSLRQHALNNREATPGGGVFPNVACEARLANRVGNKEDWGTRGAKPTPR